MTPLLRLTVLVLLLAGCAATPAPAPAPAAPDAAFPLARREALMATLWTQRAAEFRVMTTQVYRDATAKLDAALRPGTAALEQEGDFAALPPAIVLDIDETVLDNAPYQAWRLMEGREFEPVSWKKWIHMAEAQPIAGAVEFARAAKLRGIRLFYISNRDCAAVQPAPCSDKLATVDNLNNAGFPDVTPDDVLFRGERAGWHDKEARRAEVAKRHRIVMLVGDDLRDLLPSTIVADLRKPGGWVRNAAHVARMGERLFLLPNPVYGSWEDALLTERCKAGDHDCAARELAAKYKALRPITPR